MSIQIIGGGADQQTLIRQAHAQATTMATAAKTAAQGGGATFTAWFGTASTTAVSGYLSDIATALGSYAWTYDLSTLLDSYVEPEVFLSPSAMNTGAGTVTLAVWKGVFLETSLAVGQRMAALSAIHVTAEVREGWVLPSFVETAATATQYAAVNPVGAAICPRNYLEYAGAVTPAI